MDSPTTSPKIRWHLVAIAAAVTVWAIAFGFAVYVNIGPTSRLPSRQQVLDAEHKHAQQREKLEERAEWHALLRRAGRGDVEAMLEAADAYAEGDGAAPHDETEAFEWQLRAARASSIAAMLAVAERYQNGNGTTKNIPCAVEWYERAADRGNIVAARQLGDLYYAGDVVPREYAVAMRWYRKCAEAGDIRAYKRIAEMHEYGRGTPRDVTAAFFDYARVAESGDAWAQNKIGWMLATGAGVAVDYLAAAQWYQRAADRGNTLAMTNLGVAYVLGQGVEQNASIGRRLLQQAIDAGESYAMLRLADLHLRGVPGFKRDDKVAADLLKKAVDLKSDEAGVILARCYVTGKGVPKDEVRAFRQLKEIADRGSVAAKTELARLYIHGASGIRADWPQARALAKEAADEGYAPGATLYAILLKNGIGGPRDEASAREKLRLLAEQHDENAVRMLAELALADGASTSGAKFDVEAPEDARVKDPLDVAPESRVSGATGDASAPLSTARASLPPPTTPAASVMAGARVDGQPVAIYRIPPAYPSDLRLLGITGAVTIDFIVDKEGKPVNVYAANSTLAGFEAPAIAAVSQWRFKPGVKDGDPVYTHLQVPIIFTLSDDEPETSKPESPR